MHSHNLPTSDWEFSGFETETEDDIVTAVHFNFTSTTEYDPRPGGQSGNYGMLPDLGEFDVMVQIRVHMDMANPSEVKFDVIVDGWNWTYEGSILVMQFTIVESNHGQGQAERDPSGFQHSTETKFNFANGYMEYEDTALAAQNTLQVKASYGEGVGAEGGESVYLAFEYFGDETLIYDPILGVESASTSILSDPTTLLLIGGIVVVALVLVVYNMRK